MWEDSCLSCDDCAGARNDAVCWDAALTHLNAGHGIPCLQLNLKRGVSRHLYDQNSPGLLPGYALWDSMSHYGNSASLNATLTQCDPPRG